MASAAGPVKLPVGSEKLIAVQERLTDGPRDAYGRAAGRIIDMGDEPKTGQIAGLKTFTR